MKKSFEIPEMNLTVFRAQDILTTSPEAVTTRDNSGGIDLPDDPF
ncbi:MAG: hypothetical protein ACI3VX_01000 [Faecousia sp.]